ncbi:hypothetical protein [Eubacterium oxidoreducens]|uniref:Uncharacterized protein n=1 Tax=Eubacterium oxidoreducens TaxID=1732 RepID=A0A1G6B407_EUBOX|nr:hypothetical protein [Eubacterium oxidoreducens]SDB15335.1 hypothetical protein SAMN02910417_01140 [Eubacterium oxidoreducens]
MREIFEEYGGAIITAIVIVAFIVVMVALIKNGVLTDQFEALIENFSNNADSASGLG